MAGPLDSISVVDTSERSPAAAITGMLLRDLGAKVVRVEPSGGDALRSLDACRIWFRGQQSVEAGGACSWESEWRTLRDRADVIISTAQPYRDKPDLLSGWTPGPGQVLAVLTPTPCPVHDGLGSLPSEQAAYGELVEAGYGLCDEQPGHRDGPIYLGWPLATYGAAWLLTMGILAALQDPCTRRGGQTLTTSLLDGVAYLNVARWSGGPGVPPIQRRSKAAGQATSSRNRSVISLFRCADGEWVFVHTMARGAFDRLMMIVGRGDLVDPSNTNLFHPLDPPVADRMWADLRQAFNTAPAQRWFETLSAADIPCMVANPAGEALRIEQYAANGLTAQGPHGLIELGAVAKYGRTPLSLDLEPPDPGTSTWAGLLSHIRPRPRPTSPLPDDQDRPGEDRGPLEGLLILDIGMFLAGPFSPRLMADLGARVIKIEELTGDPFRGPNTSFLTANRGKESLAVDLKSQRGRGLVHQLVAGADVVHSNMRAGALRKLGIDYRSLGALNPRLIYCHSSGYGNEGPWSHLPTFEPLHSASAGVLHRTGGDGNPPLMYLSNLDLGCAFTSTICVLAALIERQRTGQGQYIEVPQSGAGLLAMSDAYLVEGEVRQTFRLDRGQRGHALTRSLYATADGWVLVSIHHPDEWDGLRRALGRAEGDWPPFGRAHRAAPGEGRDGHLLDESLKSRTASEALRVLEAHGVPCTIPTPLDLHRLPIDPLLRETGVIVLEKQTDYGAFWEPGHGVRFSESTGQHCRAAPAAGEHTRAILTELGLSTDSIDELLAEGVVASS